MSTGYPVDQCGRPGLVEAVRLSHSTFPLRPDVGRLDYPIGSRIGRPLSALAAALRFDFPSINDIPTRHSHS